MKVIKVKGKIEGFQEGEVVSAISVADAFFLVFDTSDFELQILVDKAIRNKLYKLLEQEVPLALCADSGRDGRVSDIVREFDTFFELNYCIADVKG